MQSRKLQILEANQMYEIIILLQQISLCWLNLGIVQALHEHNLLSFGIFFSVENHISLSKMLVLISTSHLSGRI